MIGSSQSARLEVTVSAMQQRYLGLFALALAACGPSNGAGEVKTPDQILAEQEAFGAKLHHRDIVGVALRRLRKDLLDGSREGVIGDVERELRHD